MKRVRRLRNGKRGTVKMWAKYGIAFITDAIFRIFSLISEKRRPLRLASHSGWESRTSGEGRYYVSPVTASTDLIKRGLFEAD